MTPPPIAPPPNPKTDTRKPNPCPAPRRRNKREPTLTTHPSPGFNPLTLITNPLFSLGGRMSRFTSVILIMLAMLAVPCFASEAFTLDIPIRGNANQETGEVRVTLTLSAAPAGSQLVVNGTTLNLGDTQTVAGDSVSYVAATGNDVRITYRPLSNFGADFCQGGFALPKSIPMRFSGAQDVVSYRISSYIVASPTVECSQPSKHTGDTPATITPV